jgi:uncharacterized membrane protein YdjX (TVP38/TMEM64 family)
MTQTDPIKEIEGGQRAQAIRLLVASLLIICVGGFLVYKDMHTIRDFILQNGAIGIGVAILIYAILGATLIPSEPLTVFVGAVFGPIAATLVATMGNLLAALVEYYIGRKISDASRFTDQLHKLPFGLGKLPVNSIPFLIFGRMLPGAGPKLVSILAGLYRVPLWRFTWTCAIPTIIGAAFFAFGGWGLSTALIK